MGNKNCIGCEIKYDQHSNVCKRCQWETSLPPLAADDINMISADGVLRDAANFFRARDAEYGQSHLRHGAIMAAFFPKGIAAITPDEHYYLHLFELIIVKLNRIAEAMTRGDQHGDSWQDTMVYAAMGYAKFNKDKEGK